MKKTFLTLTIVLGMTFSAFAQEGGGLFGKGPKSSYDGYSYRGGNEPEGLLMPTSHGTDNDQTAPLGSGALLLIGFGAAYALKKRKK